MGHGMELDVDAVTAVATTVEGTARSVSALADSVGGFAFGRAAAGRGYGDVADRIAAGYEQVASAFRRWGEALDDNAGRLRVSVDAYRAADVESAASIGAPR